MTRPEDESLFEWLSGIAVAIGGFGIVVVSVLSVAGLSFKWMLDVGYSLFLACVGLGVFLMLAWSFLSRDPIWLMRLSASGLTDLAVLLAGRRRPSLRDEWHAHLAGESGHDPVTWRKVRQALGFVASAIQFRLADAADLAWRTADSVLRSRTKSNLFVWLPVLGVVLAVVHHDGWYGLIANAQNLIETWAVLYAAVRTGRWWRGVKPPEPRARRARE